MNETSATRVSSTTTPSTSIRPELLSGAAWIVSEGPDAQDEFLDSLDDGELLALPYLFEFWAMEHQLPPAGEWRSWVAMGGRGAGKTRAGAEWVRSQMEGAKPLDVGPCRRMALVGETFDQMREVMIFGESGILACSPPDRRPVWQATRKRLLWPNGATAQAFSAHDPEGLRGPQFDSAWVDEFGCAAVDKGTNQPNKFLDAKSSESSLPKFSTGRRDELIQLQYLRAMLGYWTDTANNPISTEYGAAMLDMDHAYAWAWDTRPYPYFPNNRKLWSDGENYGRGHWLNGRMSSRTLASVVEEICGKSGLSHLDTSKLHGLVRGYSVDQTGEARSALQPLMLCAGFDTVERDGMLQCRLRDGKVNATVQRDALVRDPENDGVVEASRGSAVELPGRVRLRFVGADNQFEVLSEEATLPNDETHGISQSEMPVCLTRAEGRQTVERWLAEARVSADTVRLTLPPSQMSLGAGDVLEMDAVDGGGLFRVDRVEQMGNAQRVEGVRIEPESYRPIDIDDVVPTVRPITPPVPITPVFMDLPLMTGEEVPHAPHVAVIADPWPGAAAIYSSDIDADYQLNQIITVRSPMGVTENELAPCGAGLIDHGDGLIVKMRHGTMESVVDDAFLAGANLCAIGDGTPGGWELFQFRDAELIAEDTYVLRHRLRGQLGTENLRDDPWPIGSVVVRLDGSASQISLAEAKRGLLRHYRVGPADRPLDDEAYQHAELAFEGVGLRPYRPAHLQGAAEPGGDIAYSWIRRTRIGGDRWDTPEVPLGEENEQYLLRIVKSGTVLREEMLASPSWTYTSADQALDGLSGDFDVEVAQISASFGVGRFKRLAQSL